MDFLCRRMTVTSIVLIVVFWGHLYIDIDFMDGLYRIYSGLVFFTLLGLSVVTNLINVLATILFVYGSKRIRTNMASDSLRMISAMALLGVALLPIIQMSRMW